MGNRKSTMTPEFCFGNWKDSGVVVKIKSNGGESHLGQRALSSALGMLGVRYPTTDVPWTLELKKWWWIGFVELGMSSILRVFENLEERISAREDM